MLMLPSHYSFILTFLFENNINYTDNKMSSLQPLLSTNQNKDKAFPLLTQMEAS